MGRSMSGDTEEHGETKWVTKPKSGIWETGLAEGAGSKSSKGGEEQESGTRFIP